MEAGESLGIKKVRRNKVSNVNTNLRFNMVTVITYLVGIVLLVQLFNLQIVHGAEYREESNTRLTRESTVKAARGNITDNSGNKLVTTKTGFSLELYKTKIDNNVFNNHCNYLPELKKRFLQCVAFQECDSKADAE